CSVTTFWLRAFAESLSRWTILPLSSLRNSSTNTSITARVNRHFADETLFTTPEPFHAQRDQCHTAARLGVRATHHFHDHHTAARKPHEPRDSLDRRDKSANQGRPSANCLDRPQ